jgi:hypothetical protein
MSGRSGDDRVGTFEETLRERVARGIDAALAGVLVDVERKVGEAVCRGVEGADAGMLVDGERRA